MKYFALFLVFLVGCGSNDKTPTKKRLLNFSAEQVFLHHIKSVNHDESAEDVNEAEWSFIYIDKSSDEPKIKHIWFDGKVEFVYQTADRFGIDNPKLDNSKPYVELSEYRDDFIKKGYTKAKVFIPRNYWSWKINGGGTSISNDDSTEQFKTHSLNSDEWIRQYNK